jgi:hypothetical protein
MIPQTFRLFGFPIFCIPDNGYFINVSCKLNKIYFFISYPWVDTTAGGLLVPEGIIFPVVI